MSTITTRTLTLDRLQTLAPASFATEAHNSMSPTYRFISTSEVMGALMDAGFEPTLTVSGFRLRGGGRLR